MQVRFLTKQTRVFDGRKYVEITALKSAELLVTSVYHLYVHV